MSAAFGGVRRRLALSYAAVFAATLLLFGSALYLSFSQQIGAAADATLRLAAQRQALLALSSNGVTLGINPRFRFLPPLTERDIFYLLLAPDGNVRANPEKVPLAGLPDRAAARTAARHRYGAFSLATVGRTIPVRLFTVPIVRAGKVVALLQAGRDLTAVSAARRNLLLLLLGLGAAAVAAAAVGGLVLSRQAMRPINAAFAAQRAFVADASHELRTPLTLMRTNAEVLLEAGAVQDAEDRALVEDIIGESEHMGRLIADLLVLARLDARALTLERTPVALEPLVDSCCRQMSRLAQRGGVALTRGDVQPLIVSADEGRLEQVVLILLDNAIKYNRRGGSVEVALSREAGQALLRVRDSGPGIAPDELPHVFARFHRGRSAGTAAQGSGLGLAIAQGIVRAHGGSLRAESTPGSGSTFTVSLPLA